MGAVAVVGVLSAIGLVAALGTGSTEYRSVTTMAVVPVAQEADPSVAYQLDVVSRGYIVPTLAAALDASIARTSSSANRADPLREPWR